MVVSNLFSAGHLLYNALFGERKLSLEEILSYIVYRLFKVLEAFNRNGSDLRSYFQVDEPFFLELHFINYQRDRMLGDYFSYLGLGMLCTCIFFCSVIMI